jgi:hypothetical protein
MGLLLQQALRKLPKGATFLDAAVSFVPEEALPELAIAALNALDTGPSDLAEAMLAYLSLQQPSALHPHLDRIDAIRPNAETYYMDWPWRDSGLLQFGVLRARVEDGTLPEEQRVEAWERLMETRHPDVLRWAAGAAAGLDFPAPARYRPGHRGRHLRLGLRRHRAIRAAPTGDGDLPPGSRARMAPGLLTGSCAPALPRHCEAPTDPFALRRDLVALWQSRRLSRTQPECFGGSRIRTGWDCHGCKRRTLAMTRFSYRLTPRQSLG